MKRLIVAAVSLMVLGSASHALAWSLEPKLSTLSATGNITIISSGYPLTCKVNFKGTISDVGYGNIYSFTLSGGPAGLCRTITATNLPYFLIATDNQAGKLTNIWLVNDAMNGCGPGDLPVSIDNLGVISINSPLPVGCTITGSLQTTPVTIVVP